MEEPAKSTLSADVAAEVSAFVAAVDALATSLPLTAAILKAASNVATETYGQFLAAHAELKSEVDGIRHYNVSAPWIARTNVLRREQERARLSCDLIPPTLLVSLVSQYDAFVSRLLRATFLLRPELLSTAERQLSLATLLELGSVEAATEFIMEKEIESVLRKSHADQFTWMEGKFKLPLRVDFSSWPTFVELTERRNLFVHCAGVVSSQYMAVCKEHKVDLPPDVIPGVRLGAPPAYFEQAYRCIYEVGVKLAHVLWRKLRPDDLAAADHALGSTAFDLIVAERYTLAKELLQFACHTLKKHSSERQRLVAIINLGQTYKWLGETDQMEAILAAEDWSASETDFALCVEVLRDDFESAAATMKKIGNKGPVSESSYKDWPIFREFRKSTVFQGTFKEVFGKPFLIMQETEAPAGVGEADSADGAGSKKSIAT